MSTSKYKSIPKLYFDNSRNILTVAMKSSNIATMNIDKAANQLAELGHKTRLEIYRTLVKAGQEGLPVSAIQEKLDVPGSTLSHHISRLVQVGLVSQTREGRVLRCNAQYQELDNLIAFLSEECCQGC